MAQAQINNRTGNVKCDDIVVRDEVILGGSIRSKNAGAPVRIRGDLVVEGCVTTNNAPCEGPYVAYKGRLYRGYGPDLLPLTGSECPMFDDNGCRKGIQRTTAVAGPLFYYQFTLDNGSYMSFKNIPGITVFLPIDQATVNSFPQLVNYLNNPNYAIVIFVSESRKDDLPYTTDWVATGDFVNDNKVEFRCQYFGSLINPMNPPSLGNFDGIECLGCHWFIGQSAYGQNNLVILAP